MAQEIQEKKLKKRSPFMPGAHSEKFAAQGDWDQDYISYEIKDVVKKTGEGEDDFVIIHKVIVKRDNIAEVINSQADDVGIAAMLKRFALTNDPSVLPEPLPKDGVLNDVSGVPDNLLDADLMARDAVEAYERLPDAVKKGRSYADFCNTFTANEYIDFVVSLQPKKEEVKDGDK